jgi:CBS domain-containing protein
MKVSDLMSRNPAICHPNATIAEAARLMEQHDCGCLPVAEADDAPRPVGVVTDRDIATRAVARGRGPDTRVREVMSPEPVCCQEDDSVKAVEKIMAERQVRRVPVIDGEGCCVGMVAQADLARTVPARELARTVERISEPNGEVIRTSAEAARIQF